MVSYLPSGASHRDDAQAMFAVEAPSPYSGIAKALRAAYRASLQLPTEVAKLLARLG